MCKTLKSLEEVKEDLFEKTKKRRTKSTRRSHIDILLLFAFNSVGKTRLSELATETSKSNVLCYNSFFEDRFIWKPSSPLPVLEFTLRPEETSFFVGSDFENRIREIFEQYRPRLDFSSEISFNTIKFWFYPHDAESKLNFHEEIKISKAEESLFKWSVFLAILENRIEEFEAEETFEIPDVIIDDPVSSLDENHVLWVGCDISQKVKEIKSQLSQKNKKIKILLTTHHAFFFNVLENELKRIKGLRLKKCHLLLFQNSQGEDVYQLRCGYHGQKVLELNHLFFLKTIKEALENDAVYTYHFGMLRSVLERVSFFLGYKRNYMRVLPKLEKRIGLYSRALNLFSHGAYKIGEIQELSPENKLLLEQILEELLSNFQFEL